MKNLSKILSGFLIFAMLLCMVPGYMPAFSPAYAEVFTGEFEGFTYYFDDETGILIIDGEGPMPSFEGRMAPWSVYSDKVAHVVLSEGITSVSANAFSNFTRMEKVTLPDTIAAVDSAAFTGCAQIKSVEYTGEPAKLQEILTSSKAAEIAVIPVTSVPASTITEKIGELTEKAAAAPEPARPMPATNSADTDRSASNDRTAPSVPRLEQDNRSSNDDPAPSKPSGEPNGGSSNDDPAPSEPSGKPNGGSSNDDPAPSVPSGEPNGGSSNDDPAPSEPSGEPNGSSSNDDPALSIPTGEPNGGSSNDDPAPSVPTREPNGGSSNDVPAPSEPSGEPNGGSSNDDPAPSEPNQGQPEMPQAKSGIFYSIGNNHVSLEIEKYEDGKLISSERYMEGFVKSTTYKYDGDKLISEIMTDGTNSTTTTVYEYDGDRVIRTRSLYKPFSNTYTAETITDIQYEGDKRIETEINRGRNTGTTFVRHYDGNQLVLQESYTSSGILKNRTTTNVNGSVTTSVKEYFNEDGSVRSTETTEKTFDENGRILQQTTTDDRDGETQTSVEEYTYQFDGNNLIACERKTNRSDNTTRFSYTYDGDMITGLNLAYVNPDGSTSPRTHEASFSYAEGMLNQYTLRTDNYTDEYTIGRSTGTISSINHKGINDGKLSTESNVKFDNQRTVSRDTSSYDDNGSIVSQTLSTYTYNEDGSLAAETDESRYGERISKEEKTYTCDGNKKTTYTKRLENEVLTYESESVSVDRKDASYWSISYDSNGKTVNISEYNEDGSLKTNKSETYSKDNVKVRSSVSTYAYTDSGDSTASYFVEYDETGKQKSAQLSEVSYENGRTTSNKRTYYDANNAVQSSEIYEYEYYNQETHQKSRDKYTKYDSDGNILSLSDSTYAENGNKIKEHQISTGDQQQKIETETLYDDNNTKTKQTIKKYNGNVVDYLEFPGINYNCISKKKLMAS